MKIIVLYLFLLLGCQMYGQTVDDIGKVVLGVRFQDNASAETLQYKQLLEDKLVKLAAQAGYSSYGGNAFFISPNVVINSVDVAEGGMKNVYVVRGDLYLTILDDIGGTVYSSMSYSFKGSATKKETAIKNALIGINYNNVSSIFGEAKSKILTYYKEKKDVIFKRSDTFCANGDYDGAIACLMEIPEELSDVYTEALYKAQEVYDRRDEAIRQQMLAERHERNDSVLTKANSYLSMHNPQEALKVLWDYQKGDEKQDSQYSSMIAKAESLVTSAEREEMRKAERAYLDKKIKENREWSEYTKNTAHRREMEEKTLNATERVAHHKLNVSAQRISAFKSIACEYIRSKQNQGNMYY